MPPIHLEDGDSLIAQLPTNHCSTTASAHPDLVTRDIILKIGYISTIEDLQTAQEWRITSHEPITRDNVEIISVTPTLQSPCVIMAVSGVDSEGVPFGRKLFTERDIHLVSGPKLFRYWRGKGGRAYASGILDDVCHLLKILDEQDGKRQVQFVGCAKSQSEWWDSDKVKETYIELWDEWVQARDAIRQESD